MSYSLNTNAKLDALAFYLHGTVNNFKSLELGIELIIYVEFTYYDIKQENCVIIRKISVFSSAKALNV
jgi:hypothetical protein